MPNNFSLVKTVEEELMSRILHIEKIIPHDAFFKHVAPFFCVQLTEMDIIEILKNDVDFFHSNNVSESELQIFAEILKKILDHKHTPGSWNNRIRISVDYCLSKDLEVSFEDVKDLQDILSGKFLLKINKDRIFVALLFASIAMTFGFIYGGVRHGLGNFNANNIPIGQVLLILGVVAGLFSAFFSYHSMREFWKERMHSQKHKDLMDFYDKYKDRLAPRITTDLQDVSRSLLSGATSTYGT